MVYLKEQKTIKGTLQPHRYQAERKGMRPITMPPGVFRTGHWRDMELILFIECYGGPNTLHPQVSKRVFSSFLMEPHPKDKKAVNMLTPTGWWRAILELTTGKVFFNEEGTISFERAPGQSWPVIITRRDVFNVYGSNPSRYKILFTVDTDPTHFIQTLHDVGASQGQATVLLQSPGIKVKAVYQTIPLAIERLGEALKWCPLQ